MSDLKPVSLSVIVPVPTSMLEDAEAIGAIVREGMELGLAWAFWLPDVSGIVRRRFKRAGVHPNELRYMSRDAVLAIPGIGPKTIAALEAAGW